MYSLRLEDIFWGSAMLAISFCLVYFMVWLIEEGFRIYISSIFADIPNIETINCFMAMVGACAVLLSATIICTRDEPCVPKTNEKEKKKESERTQSKLDSF